jgi:hypothetical protein
VLLIAPGAGDDASNVGVMLELAANLIATPADQLPDSPVMFLFSGAEEPLCQVREEYKSTLKKRKEQRERKWEKKTVLVLCIMWGCKSCKQGVKGVQHSGRAVISGTWTSVILN